MSLPTGVLRANEGELLIFDTRAFIKQASVADVTEALILSLVLLWIHMLGSEIERDSVVQIESP